MSQASGYELTAYLSEMGLLDQQPSPHPTSSATFPDGAAYHIEIPSVEGPEALRVVLAAAAERGVRVHRISQGSGIMMQTDDEIKEMVEIGRQNDVEICLFVGPRAEWDTGVQASTKGGRPIAPTLRGADQLLAGIEDVRHGCELGLRCVLVADLGQLWMLGKMRDAGLLPADLRLKVSASLPASNPATARLMQDLGADTINVPVDLSVTQLAELRAAVDVPIDIYIEAPDDFGAVLRYHDVPEIVRVAAPVHLKFAVRNAAGIYPYGHHLRNHALDTARERVRRASLAIQILERGNRTTNSILADGLAGRLPS